MKELQDLYYPTLILIFENLAKTYAISQKLSPANYYTTLWNRDKEIDKIERSVEQIEKKCKNSFIDIEIIKQLNELVKKAVSIKMYVKHSVETYQSLLETKYNN